MRLFTAVDPSPEVLGRLADLLERLRPTARLRWSPPENLHLTLKFIGQWPDEKLGSLEETLRRVVAPAPFEVKVRGLGFFPHARAPRVFWVGVEVPAELVDLASRIDRALEPMGVPPETRAYKPHFTLARIPDGQRLGELQRVIEGLESTDFGTFRPHAFYLYESRLSPKGSVYTKIGDFPWAA